jgi:hypothetical protein
MPNIAGWKIPDGFQEISIYTNGEQFVICEQDGIDLTDDHNCDQMGCGSLSHVVARGPLEELETTIRRNSVLTRTTPK